MPRLAVLSVLSAASSHCPDLNLIHYKTQTNADYTIYPKFAVFRRPLVLKKSSETLALLC
ncbi:hypothetical protein MCC93_12770 [Morococcus cerebrosus]|uniref:Uncharacterized protein n=1 Tax=Morococcus cerebrosus TaxID=1056807 RepID=A0A0C1H1Y7_9NEIS|nr:hypothetical protein MCC93_12770 [Morococcus cerebrosus]